MNDQTEVNIAVVFPSRGMVFSQTFEELLRELKPYNHRVFFAHGLPIPDCFNKPTERALKDKTFTHVLFCEDDMMLPKNILKKMLKVDYPAMALDYPYKEDGEATILHDPDGMALYSGTGFLLVHRWVLDRMPKPVFRTDRAWDMEIKGTKLRFWPRDMTGKKTYGLHDVEFGLTLWSNQIPIMPMAPAGQRKLVQYGDRDTNDGAHKIKTITKVLKDNITKNTSKEQLKKFLMRLNAVNEVELLPDTPDDITYVDGVPTKKEKHEVI